MNRRSGDDLHATLRSKGVLDPETFVSHCAQLGDPLPWAKLLATLPSPHEGLIAWQRLTEVAPELLRERDGSLNGEKLERINAVFSLSRALGDYIIADPSRISSTWLTPPPIPREQFHHWVEEVFAAEAANLHTPATLPYKIRALRRAYRQVLLGIVADDAQAPCPFEVLDTVAWRMSVLVDITLQQAFAIACDEAGENAPQAMAVIAMGKTGAMELNYISDVDVIYVCSEAEADIARSVAVASTILTIVSGTVFEGNDEESLWVLDTALRPEGKDGALVRTVPSYIAYWEKWAQTWEFQALMKARACAGNTALGHEFEQAAANFTWISADREGFVEDARAMRKRVESSVPAREADRELKLGKGGLRDVEFSIQLLQLVHGRSDETLRHRGTLDAINALAAGGYVSRADAQELSQHYRFLRVLEHRCQVARMRRTHLLPQQSTHLSTIARSVGFNRADEMTSELDNVRSRVRALHEDMFYRPIVAATAGLRMDSLLIGQEADSEVLRFDRQAVLDRLGALGFIDTHGALRHIQALTAGTSRRAQIQRHLLPVFLSWLSDSADPDMGLLNFRILSDRIGQTHWYLRLLRDSRTAAERLLNALSSSRWVAAHLELRPEAVRWLDHGDDLLPLEPSRVCREVLSVVERHPDPEEAALRVRAIRTRELTRAALADATFNIQAVRSSIAEATDAALEGALAIALREEERAHGKSVDIALIAMGRYGGMESGYASDADVMAIHRARGGVGEAEASQAAYRVVTHVQHLLGTTASHAGVSVDLALRPEGKKGPLSRTVDSFRDYYERWAMVWERQALLRARPCAGESSLRSEVIAVVDPIRYERVPSEAELREIRLLKARMERERLPRGVEPTRHVKLGPGGLSDVEWTVQLLQMKYACEFETLRTSSTVEALEAVEAIGLLSAQDVAALHEAWSHASRIRSANVLVSGRMSGAKLDQLPRRVEELAPLARLMGYEAGNERALEDDWLRRARLARTVMDHVFWD